MLICLSEIINLWGKQRTWLLHVYLWQQRVSRRAMRVNPKRHSPRWTFWRAPLFPSVCVCPLFLSRLPTSHWPNLPCVLWVDHKSRWVFSLPAQPFYSLYFTGSRVWFSNSVASCQNHWRSIISVSGMRNGVEFPNKIQTMHEASRFWK